MIDLKTMVDRRRGSIYDRIQYLAGQVSLETIRCFERPVGPDRDFTDTNMLTACMFPAPQDILIQRIVLLFQPTVTESDRNRFLAAYHWELSIIEKTMYREPVLRCSLIAKPEDFVPDFGKVRIGPNGERLEGEGSKLVEIGNHACWELEEYQTYIPPIAPFKMLLCGSPVKYEADFDMYVMVEGLRDYGVV